MSSTNSPHTTTPVVVTQSKELNVELMGGTLKGTIKWFNPKCGGVAEILVGSEVVEVFFHESKLITSCGVPPPGASVALEVYLNKKSGDYKAKKVILDTDTEVTVVVPEVTDTATATATATAIKSTKKPKSIKMCNFGSKCTRANCWFEH